jgi:hypothetical protein
MRPFSAILAFSPALLHLTHTHAGVFEATFATPTVDRWVYPFGDASGARAFASTFTTLWNNTTGVNFDDRDGEFLLIFATSPAVPAGFPASRYTLTTLDLTCALSVAAPSEAPIYDPTVDALSSYFNPGNAAAQPPIPADPAFTPDADAGRPIELFAAAFRSTFTASTFPENAPFGVAPGSQGVRAAYPIDFGPAGLGPARDVSNHVTGWTPDGPPFTPFQAQSLAVAQARGATGEPFTPGDALPDRARLLFSAAPASGAADAYLRSALSQGHVALIVSSLHPAPSFGAGAVTYPVLITKENPLGPAPTLRLTVRLCIADLAGPGQTLGADGTFTADDIIVFINAFFAADAASADVAGPGQTLGPDGTFSADDIIVFINAYFAQCL